MKRYLTAILLIMAAGSMHAQNAAQNAAQAISEAKPAEAKKDRKSLWTDDATAKVSLTNTQLTNWAAGGYNTLSLQSSIDAAANYKDGPMYWNNHLQLEYGFISSADKPVLQKNTDRIYFESKWGLKATDKLSYSANYDFKSQFTKSYKYNTPGGEDPTKQDWLDSRLLQSGPFSPATTQIGFGIDWIPNKNNWLVVNLSPLTGGFTIVGDKELRPKYSMPKLDDGSYKPARFEFGAKLKVDAKFKINDVFSYKTQVVLFSDYLDKPLHPRVNWDNFFDWQLAKHLAITFNTYLIYDEKILIDGVPKTQFKEYLLLSFKYNFKPIRRD